MTTYQPDLWADERDTRDVPLTCPSCGATEPTRWAALRNHGQPRPGHPCHTQTLRLGQALHQIQTYRATEDA